MAPHILLVTTMKWPTSAKLAAAFAAVCAQVDALYPSGHVKSRSRFVAGHHIYRRLFPLTSLVAALEQSNPDLIVPCDDRAVRWLIALHRRGEFVSLIERSLGRVENYPGLSARNAFMQGEGKRPRAGNGLFHYQEPWGCDRCCIRGGQRHRFFCLSPCGRSRKRGCGSVRGLSVCPKRESPCYG